MERYQRANLQQAQVGATSQSSASMAASNLSSLADRLQSFSNMGMQVLGEQAADQAIQDASNDDFNQQPFHKESVHTIYGKAYNNARSATYTANGEMELNNVATQYAIDYSNDPQGFTRAFGTYQEELLKESPTPEIRAALTITGKKIQNHNFGKLSIKKDADIKAQELATYSETIGQKIGQASNAAANGDFKTHDLILNGMEVYSNTMIASDVISPADYENIKITAKHQVSKKTKEQHMTDLIESGNMEGAKHLKDSYSSEVPSDTSIEQHDDISKSITSLYNTAVKGQQTSAKLYNKQSNKSVKQAIKKMKKGVTDDKEIVVDKNTLSAADADVQEEYNIQTATNGIMAETANMTQLEKESWLSQYKNKPEYTSLDKSVQKAVEDSIISRRKGYKEDPILQGEIEGSYNATPAIDITMDEELLVDILDERFLQMEINMEDAGIDAGKILKTEELQGLVNYIEGEDIAVQMQVLGMISGLDNEISSVIYNQLDKKGAGLYAQAGKLISNGETNIANSIIIGSKTEVNIDTTDQMKQVDGILISVLGTNDINMINNQRKNAEYYIKGQFSQYGTMSNGINAIESIYGKTTSYNGKKIFLPKGIGKSEFDDFLGSYTVPGDAGLTEEIQELGGMWASGDVQLHYDEDNKYLLFDPSTGKYRATSDGKLLEINYGD